MLNGDKNGNMLCKLLNFKKILRDQRRNAQKKSVGLRYRAWDDAVWGGQRHSGERTILEGKKREEKNDPN